MHTIRDWPVDERPREKLLKHGPDTLSPAELLAILLRTGRPGRDVLELARRLLTDFGGLRPLLEADRGAFCAHHGLGVASYTTLQAALELGRRQLQAELGERDCLDNPATTRRFLARS